MQAIDFAGSKQAALVYQVTRVVSVEQQARSILDDNAFLSSLRSATRNVNMLRVSKFFMGPAASIAV